MTIHPVLLRALLTAVVAEVGDEQREALASGTTTARIAAEDRLVDDLMAAIAIADHGKRESSPRQFTFIPLHSDWPALVFTYRESLSQAALGKALSDVIPKSGCFGLTADSAQDDQSAEPIFIGEICPGTP